MESSRYHVLSGEIPNDRVSSSGNAEALFGTIPDHGSGFAGNLPTQPQYHVGTPGPPGPQGVPGYTPVRGKDYWTDADKEEIVKDLKNELQQGEGVNFKVDESLTLENGILSVNTTNEMEQDNTLPITSAGVFATVGNIEALLKTI